MLLSRVADRLYWSARFLERAEDTARIVRAFTDLVADTPSEIEVSWEPLVAIAGSGEVYRQHLASAVDAVPTDMERAVVMHLVVDPANLGSVRSCVASSRENLRTTRDVAPREAWEALNHLYLFTERESDRGLIRSHRNRFLTRVLSDSRRIDGILATSMTHDEAYVMWRLGRALERADMTTRVLGVRAVAVLEGHPVVTAHDGAQGETASQAQTQSQTLLGQEPGAKAPRRGEAPATELALEWMGVLRSVAALQMYQRAVRGPIDGQSVVDFLLFHERFPRAVRCCLREFGLALRELPDPAGPLGALDGVLSALEAARGTSASGAADLDEAIDHIQNAIAELDRRLAERYLRVDVVPVVGAAS